MFEMTLGELLDVVAFFVGGFMLAFMAIEWFVSWHGRRP